VDLLTFIGTVVVVTASGALAPGPLFFTNITHGTRSGARGGFVFSVGHTIFELGLVLVLALTLQTVANEPLIKIVVGVVGGVALLLFGLLQIRGALKPEPTSASKIGTSLRHPLLIGTVFTALNPYFLIWWLTVGMTLIVNALALASFAGVLIMYVSHVWMDYAWLTGTAYLAKKGTSLVGGRGYRIIMLVFGAILILFGVYFLVSSYYASIS
jgi:threonine/homoserine/homoserine lactone efflux protein